MNEYGSWIDGREVDAGPRSSFPTFDPSTGAEWATVICGTQSDVDRAVVAARRAGEPGSPWRGLNPSERRRLLLELAGVIRANSEELAVVESRDAGKLLRETRLHVDACVEWLEFFAGYTDKVLGATIPVDEGVLNYTEHVPRGVVGAIVPGNSPLLLTIWKIAPALAAGNTMVIKPSEFTTASLITLMRLWGETLPAGVVNVVAGLGPEVGNAIAEHPGVRMMAFTGSTRTGALVAATTAARLVPSILELGGKSANIVFADANFEKAIAGIMAGVFAASGQTCMAGSRVLVQREIFDQVRDELICRTGKIVVGPTQDLNSQVGPIGSAVQLERIEGLVARAVAHGAKVCIGGQRAHVPDHLNGWYYKPTIVTDVANGWEIACEEIFGPVMMLIPFDTEAEAIQIANDSDFGLVAGLWTTNLSRAHRMGRALDVGTVFVNLYRKVSPQTPFGGNGKSGIGRENGLEVMLEYTQVRSVLIDLDDERVQDPFLMRVGVEA